MPKPEEILNAEDYKNYLNVHAVALLFAFFGGVILLGGITFFFAEFNKESELRPLARIAMGVGFMILGLTGLIGGVATMRGNRRWAYLSYGMGVVYLFAFPLGTILSCVMLDGLPQYLNSVERLKNWNGETRELAPTECVDLFSSSYVIPQSLYRR